MSIPLTPHPSPLTPHLSPKQFLFAADRDPSRKPNLVKMQNNCLLECSTPVATSTTQPLQPSVGDLHRRMGREILRARRSQHLLWNSAFCTVQGSCCHGISTIWLPQQDLDNGNISRYAIEENGKSPGVTPTSAQIGNWWLLRDRVTQS